MDEQISPTRMNLLATRVQLKFVKQGIDLLKRKKDAMLNEFLLMVAEVYTPRMSLQEQLQKKVESLVIAEAVHGTHPFASAAMATKQKLNIKIQEKNIWGVKTFDIGHSFKVRDSSERNYSQRGIETAVDVTANGFEEIVQLILELIPAKIKLNKVGNEIKATNRKINALQQQLLPRLQHQAVRIAQILEERAREDTFRLKKLKRKKRRN